MSPIVNMTVPAEEAELVLGALLAIYAAHATNVVDHVGRADEQRLRDARDQLAEAEQMLDTFGWESGPRVRAAELCGPEAAVGAVLRYALSDAIEELGSDLEAYHSGSAELERPLASLENLRGLLGRFAAFEREHAL